MDEHEEQERDQEERGAGEEVLGQILGIRQRKQQREREIHEAIAAGLAKKQTDEKENTDGDH